MPVYYNCQPDQSAWNAQPVYAPPSIPLYVAAFVVMQMGLLAVGLVFGDARFSNLTMGLCTIGVIVSYISRRQRVGPKSIEAQAFLFCLFLATIVFFGE